MTENGLIIRNITESDNGEYTCRGEVETDGRYSESMISVTVHSKLWLEPEELVRFPWIFPIDPNIQ